MKLPFILSILLSTVISSIPIDARAQEKTEAFIRGRVMHEGKPVARAAITLADPPLPNGAPIRLPWVARHSETDAEGYFQLSIARKENYGGPLQANDAYVIFAWKDELGEGDIGPMRFDLKEPAQDLEIEITRAPGSIEGRVLLPEGRSYNEVWLTSEPGFGYARLNRDGSYRLPGIPAGKVTIRILESYDVPGSFQPASTSSNGRPKDGWFWMTHGPDRGPQWMTVDPVFEVIVPPGESLQFELDLSLPAQCFIHGKLILNGDSLPYTPAREGLWSPPSPKVSLWQNERRDFMTTYCDPNEAGEFRLGVHSEAKMNLHVQMVISGQEKINLWEPVDLAIGTLDWNANISTGSLIIRLEPKRSRLKHHRLHLRMENPDGSGMSYTGSQRIIDGAARFPSAPAGRFNLLRRSNSGVESVLRSVVVVAGETTIIELLD